MSDKLAFNAVQLAALAQHLQEVLHTITDVNNALLARLGASEDLSDTDRATLNRWSTVINDVHTASEAHIMEIGSIAPPAGVQ